MNKEIFIFIIFLFVNILSLYYSKDFISVIKEVNTSANLWDARWEADFIERAYSPQIGVGETIGNMSYDKTNNLFYVYRKEGMYDKYCGSIYIKEPTSCVHLVRDNKRYIYFPDKNFCCMCCTSDQGCGIIKTDWVKNYGTYYTTTVIDGNKVNEFLILDTSKIIYDEYVIPETPQKSIPIRINYENISDMHIIKNSYKEGIKNSEIFNLPKNMKNCEKSCGYISNCPI